MKDFLFIVVALALASIALYLAGRLFRKTIVHEWRWGLHYKNGKFQEVLTPGAYRWFQPGHEVRLLDRRRQLEIIPGQEVLTQDNVGVKISLVAEYRIDDPVVAMREVEDTAAYLHAAAQVAIREAVGKRGLDELLGDRTAIVAEVQESAVGAMKPMGVEVTSVQLRDIMLGKELRAGYAAVLAARKEGEAALERARGETAALRSLANAARMIKDGAPHRSAAPRYRTGW